MNVRTGLGDKHPPARFAPVTQRNSNGLSPQPVFHSQDVSDPLFESVMAGAAAAVIGVFVVSFFSFCLGH